MCDLMCNCYVRFSDGYRGCVFSGNGSTIIFWDIRAILTFFSALGGLLQRIFGKHTIFGAVFFPNGTA